jgi:hypothetical protein
MVKIHTAVISGAWISLSLRHDHHFVFRERKIGARLTVYKIHNTNTKEEYCGKIE